MQLPVPFISQHSNVADPAWQKEICTIANLAMVLLYYKKEVPTEELVAEGKSIGGYVSSAVGWDHESIVRLARNHGVHAYRQEFRSGNEVHQERMAQEGVEKLARHIEGGDVVLVSVRNNFDASRGYHTVLLIGIERDDNKAVASFVYHDPDDTDREGENQKVDKTLFLEHWRRLSIFFENA